MYCLCTGIFNIPPWHKYPYFPNPIPPYHIAVTFSPPLSTRLLRLFACRQFHWDWTKLGVPDMDMSQDEAFLSLLSSQRQLLRQLNTEKVSRRVGEGAGTAQSRKSRVKPFYMNRSPRCTLNQAANQRLSNEDMFVSRRFSSGIESEQFLLPNFNIDEGEGSSSFPGHSKFSAKNRNKIDENFDVSRWKKRRLSSTCFGFLTESAFDDDAVSSCVNSLFAWGSDIHRTNDSVCHGLDESHEIDPDDDLSIGATSIEPIGVGVTVIDPNELKRAMEDFNSAMEKSQQSQQDIHDWDRKMGLKRSHSKTMRLSSRSRKQLLSSLKRAK